MAKIDTKKIQFKNQSFRHLTEAEVCELSQYLFDEDTILPPESLRLFEDDLENTIDDFIEGSSNFSKYLNPSQKVKILSNIVSGCSQILDNINMYDDPHLQYDFDLEKLEEIDQEAFDVFSKIKKPFKSFSVIKVLTLINKTLMKYCMMRIKYYEASKASKGGKEDIKQHAISDLIALFTRHTKITYTPNESTEYIDSVESFIITALNFFSINDTNFQTHHPTMTEAEQSRLRRRIKYLVQIHLS